MIRYSAGVDSCSTRITLFGDKTVAEKGTEEMELKRQSSKPYHGTSAVAGKGPERGAAQVNQAGAIIILRLNS